MPEDSVSFFISAPPRVELRIKLKTIIVFNEASRYLTRRETVKQSGGFLRMLVISNIVW
jgi:hypothetical protein